jgi:WD domain, G-beta repeat
MLQLVLTSVLSACGGQKGEVHSSPPEPAQNREVVSPKPKTPTPAPATADVNSSADGPVSPPRADAPPSQYRVDLPFDEVLLKRQLPARSADRYPAFRERKVARVGHGYLYDAQYLPGDESVVVSSAEEKAFRVYGHGAKLQANVPIPGSADFEALAIPWPPSAESVVIASEAGVARVSARTGDVEAKLSERAAHRLRWSDDGQVLIAVESKIPEQTSVLRLFVRQGDVVSLRAEMSFPERVDGIALSRDNRLLAVSEYPSDTLRVIDLRSGQNVVRSRAPKYVSSLDFSPDGRWLAVGGEALVVLDLVHPDRTAHYGYLYNNINTVRFSPSGDAVLASSYDGRIRILALDGAREDGTFAGPPTLRLVRELRHSGSANVYGFDVRSDGDEVVSASGDQTVRWFTLPKPTAQDGARRTFQSLDERLKTEPPSRRWPEELPAPEAFRIDSISAVGATRLPLGRYACKITMLYRLRDCTVKRNQVGQTVLSFGDGNLLPLDAIVTDDGKGIRLVAALREPSSLYDCPGCLGQPILGVLQGGPKRFEGVLVLRRYFDPLVTPPLPALDTKVEEAQDRFPVVLEYRGPLD